MSPLYLVKQIGEYRQYACPHAGAIGRIRGMFNDPEYLEFRKKALEKRIADYESYYE